MGIQRGMGLRNQNVFFLGGFFSFVCLGFFFFLLCFFFWGAVRNGVWTGRESFHTELKRKACVY